MQRGLIQTNTMVRRTEGGRIAKWVQKCGQSVRWMCEVLPVNTSRLFGSTRWCPAALWLKPGQTASWKTIDMSWPKQWRHYTTIAHCFCTVWKSSLLLCGPLPSIVHNGKEGEGMIAFLLVQYKWTFWTFYWGGGECVGYTSMANCIAWHRIYTD